MSKIFETCDTPTAAYLVTLGHEVADMRWDGRQCFIAFPATERLDEHLVVLSQGDACVEPREFNRAMTVLKNDIFACKPVGVR